MFKNTSKYQTDLIERSRKEREESINKYNKNLHPSDRLDEQAALAAILWLGAIVFTSSIVLLLSELIIKNK